MIILEDPEEIEIMARASRVVAETLAMLKREVRPGMTTDELDRLAEAVYSLSWGDARVQGISKLSKNSLRVR